VKGVGKGDSRTKPSDAWHKGKKRGGNSTETISPRERRKARKEKEGIVFMNRKKRNSVMEGLKGSEERTSYH